MIMGNPNSFIITNLVACIFIKTKIIKLREFRWADDTARIEDGISVFKIVSGKLYK